MEDSRPPRTFMLPFILWMAGQLGAFCLAAGDVPLFRGQAAATELWATPLLLLTQVLLAAALWTDLLANRATALLTAATVLPMLALAGGLSGEAYQTTLLAAAVSLLWLGGLCLWRFSLSRAWQPGLTAILLAWLLGGLALAYVRAEFGLPPGSRVFAPCVAASPILAALRLWAEPQHCLAWLTMAAPLATSLPLAVRRLRQLRQCARRSSRASGA